MKKGYLAIVIGLMMVVAGCTTEKDETKIAGKTYTVKDFEKLDIGDGYDYDVKDKVIVTVLDGYYKNVEGVDEEYKAYLANVADSGKELTKDEQAQVKSSIRYSKQMKDAYEELVKIPEADVKKATDEGYPVLIIEHAILAASKLEADEVNVDKVKERMEKAETNDDYTTLRDEFVQEELASMERSEMTEATVIPGFEEILDKNVGETVLFGDGNYRSVMKVLAKQNATAEQVKVSMQNKKISEDYKTAEDFLLGLEKLHKGLTFSEEVKELLKKD